MKKDFKKLYRLLYESLLLFHGGASIPYQIQQLRSDTGDHYNKYALIFAKAVEDLINIFPQPNFWDQVGRPIDVKILRNSHIFHAVKRAPVVTERYDPISTYVLVQDLINIGWFPVHKNQGSTPRRTLQKGSKPVLLKGFNNHWVRLAYYGIVMQDAYLPMFKEFSEHGLVPNLLVSNSHLGNSKCKLQIVLQHVDVFSAISRGDATIAREIVVPDTILGEALTHRWMNEEKSQRAVHNIQGKMEHLLRLIQQMKERKLTDDDRASIEKSLYAFFFKDRNDVSIQFIDRHNVLFGTNITNALQLMWSLYDAIVFKGIGYTLLPNADRDKKRHMTLKVTTGRSDNVSQAHYKFTQQLFAMFNELLTASD